MMRSAFAVVVVALSVSSAAQQPETPGAAFEVASIKPAKLSERVLLRRVFERWRSVQPVYALVPGKLGHKLSSQDLPCAKPGPAVISFSTVGSMESCKPSTTMAQLAQALNNELDRPVVDRTGLAGRYAFRLQWAGREPLPGTDAAPSLFTAVQDQLGLRLEPSTDLVEALVIDGVEPPTPN
jgi:uncharacterized protein (TIGR03435 family)